MTPVLLPFTKSPVLNRAYCQWRWLDSAKFKRIVNYWIIRSVTHPVEWRSGVCSLQRAGSCSLRETRIKPHQMCECGVVRTDCTSLSHPPHKLKTAIIHKYLIDGSSRTGRHVQCNISDMMSCWSAKTKWTHVKITCQVQQNTNSLQICPHTHLKHIWICTTLSITNIILSCACFKTLSSVV